MIALLIPAYKPDKSLVALVAKCLERVDGPILIVNDGSPAEFQALFNALKAFDRVTVLTHEINLGKGQALKTGFKFLTLNYPQATGVVTADADGQHLVEDIERVVRELAQYPQYLILGARQFGDEVPLRSRFGNILTRIVFRFFLGTKITDTQTGLRGIPLNIVRDAIHLKSSNYDFEMDMLVSCKQSGVEFREVPIRTVYLDGNKSSHFNPILDSLRIYFVFFRFMGASLTSAVLDYSVFFLVFHFYQSVVVATVMARICTLLTSYYLIKGFVFKKTEWNWIRFAQYLGLVAVMGCFSIAMTKTFYSLGFSIFLAKLASEGALYFANFVIQREFIFKGKKGSPSL